MEVVPLYHNLNKSLFLGQIWSSRIQLLFDSILYFQANFDTNMTIFFPLSSHSPRRQWITDSFLLIAVNWLSHISYVPGLFLALYSFLTALTVIDFWAIRSEFVRYGFENRMFYMILWLHRLVCKGIYLKNST